MHVVTFDECLDLPISFDDTTVQFELSSRFTNVEFADPPYRAL